MWFQHIIPSIKEELQSSEVLAAALRPILQMIEDCTFEEYQNYIYPIIKTICLMPKSVQVSLTQTQFFN